MKYIKTFEARRKKEIVEYYDFYNDFFDKKIRDVDHYINIINNKHISLYEAERLFHWTCRFDFPELAIALLDVIPTSSLRKLSRSISSLPYKEFKQILVYNDLQDFLIKSNDFISYVIYNSNENDVVKKLKYLKKNGVVFTNNQLNNAAYANKLNAVKFLIEKEGIDVTKKEISFDVPYTCLDNAISNNSVDVIEYLVKNTNVPVTYRHMKNVIDKKNLKSLPILLKSKNITDDYGYSKYSNYNRNPIYLSDIVNTFIRINLDNYIIPLLDKTTSKGYDIIQLIASRSKDGYDFLDKKYLDLAYWIISNTNISENSYNTIIVTRGHKDYWLKKMKENPSIINKMKHPDDDMRKSYEFQKLLLDTDESYVKYIINDLNPRIINEYDHIPEIFDKTISKYNL